MTSCNARAILSGAATPEAPGQREPDVLDDLCHTPAELPPGGHIRLDRWSDRDLDPAERSQHVSAAGRNRNDRQAALKCEISDSRRERPEGPTARVTAFGKDQPHAVTLEHLVDGAQPRLVELAAVRRDGQDSDQGQQTALPVP